MAIKFDDEYAPYSVDESLPWTPFTPHSELVSVKLYAADPARGEVIILLRTPPGVELPAHRSTGQTTIYTLQGQRPSATRPDDAGRLTTLGRAPARSSNRQAPHSAGGSPARPYRIVRNGHESGGHR
jgi:hypothetical protein